MHWCKYAVGFRTKKFDENNKVQLNGAWPWPLVATLSRINSPIQISKHGLPICSGKDSFGLWRWLSQLHKKLLVVYRCPCHRKACNTCGKSGDCNRSSRAFTTLLTTWWQANTNLLGTPLFPNWTKNKKVRWSHIRDSSLWNLNAVQALHLGNLF